MNAVARNVDAWNLVDDGVDLGDDDAALEGGRLDHRRRVLGVRPCIEIAIAVGADRGDQRDIRRQIDEIAGEEFEIGVDRAKCDLAPEQHLGDAPRLRTGIGVVEPPRDARFKHVEVLGKHDAGLHHMEVMYFGRIDASERGGQEIGLLLIVAFEADPVERPYRRLEQGDRMLAGDDLALRQSRACGETLSLRRPPGIPLPHRPALLTRKDTPPAPPGRSEICPLSFRVRPSVCPTVVYDFWIKSTVRIRDGLSEACRGNEKPGLRKQIPAAEASPLRA